MQTQFESSESIEQLNECLGYFPKIRLTSHVTEIFLVEAPQFSGTSDIWIKLKLQLPTSNIILRRVGKMRLCV